MTEPRWVKLSERKPEKRGYVYFYDPTGSKRMENIITAGWFFSIPTGATHWLELELPPLPKKDNIMTEPYKPWEGKHFKEYIESFYYKDKIIEALKKDWDEQGKE